MDSRALSAPDAPAWLGRWEACVRQARERARAQSRPVLASLARGAPSEAGPLAVFGTAGRQGEAYRTLWARPSQGFVLAGVGAAAVLEAAGPRPAGQLRRVWRDLLDGAVVEGPGSPPSLLVGQAQKPGLTARAGTPAPPDERLGMSAGRSARVKGVGPVCLGGFRFDPAAPRSSLWSGFPEGLLVLPRFLVTRSGGQSWVTVNLLVRPEADPDMVCREAATDLAALTRGTLAGYGQPPVDREAEEPTEEWTGGVRRALAAIARGEMTKVVLARRRTLHARGGFSVDAAVEYLAATYPECATFALELGAAAFLGASPEALVHLDGGVLSLSCLAGSAARGATPEEDEGLARQLLASAKERREHAAVVAQVTGALGQTCADVSWDATPRVVKLATVQHLATLVTGRPQEAADILNLLEVLHPTPAVGGVPTEKALAAIRALEGDRGWYSAPVGWVDQRGEGEFNVGIRSALLRGDEATLFAGSGIVEGSEPERELAETELKFQPMLRALRQA